jgi:hypothetical protein
LAGARCIADVDLYFRDWERSLEFSQTLGKASKGRLSWIRRDIKQVGV